MSYYPTDSGHLSRRLVAFLAIIAVHALVIWAFISGFANQGARYVQTILETNIIQTEKPKDLPPPPPPVDLKERPPVQVIAPEINITVPVEAPPPPITNVTSQPQAPPPPRAIVPGLTGEDHLPARRERLLSGSLAPQQRGRPAGGEDLRQRNRQDRLGRYCNHLRASAAGRGRAQGCQIDEVQAGDIGRQTGAQLPDSAGEVCASWRITADSRVNRLIMF
jgi:hypothetical protein